MLFLTHFFNMYFCQLPYYNSICRYIEIYKSVWCNYCIITYCDSPETVESTPIRTLLPIIVLFLFSRPIVTPFVKCTFFPSTASGLMVILKGCANSKPAPSLKRNKKRNTGLLTKTFKRTFEEFV